MADRGRRAGRQGGGGACGDRERGADRDGRAGRCRPAGLDQRALAAGRRRRRLSLPARTVLGSARVDRDIESIDDLPVDVLEVPLRPGGIAVDVEYDKECAEPGPLAGGIDFGPFPFAAVWKRRRKATLLAPDAVSSQARDEDEGFPGTPLG